ncbi:hypothetical protein RJ639_007770 [Escallonia herrerae]|uniref:Transposase (putative) gypsy type domain-containing protein n=1 Tax=Escallonia herrerae TaxID=1293975 RepID=A0AA88VWU0_9ASTE|nr:hypothetical protein RJ639_007770 [Escallonia herrerae]
MSKTSTSASAFEKDIVVSNTSSSSSERVPTSGSEVGTSNPQPSQPSTSQPPQPSTSQPSHSLSAKNALEDVKDQAEDKANPKPWYSTDEKLSKMSTKDLLELIQEYPLPEGWYARLPGLQEPANYGTKFETGIYEEQVKSGYRLPLHPFALCFFKHYHMALGRLVPNGWRKLTGLICLVQTSGYNPNATDFMKVFFKICFVKGVTNCPGWYYIHSGQRLLKGGPKSNKGWHSRYFFVGHMDKGWLPFDRDWNPYCKDFKNPSKPTPNNLTKHILSHIKLRGGLSIDEPLSEQQLEWAMIILRRPVPAGALIPPPPATFAESIPLEMDSGSEKSPQGGFLGVLQRAKGKRKEKQPNSQISEQHLVHGVLPRTRRFFKTRLTRPLFVPLLRLYTRRQVAAEEAQQKRDDVKEVEEATRHAEELSKQEADYFAQIETLKRRLERKRTDDGLEIYEMGFMKAKEIFVERFSDIPLGDFVMPAVVSPSGETTMPSKAGDAAALHPPRGGPSEDAPGP